MAGEQTREEVAARLEAIFSSAMEGGDLEKALASIDKRLDKFEGKWPKLILWAEEKYGHAETNERVSSEENAIQQETPGVEQTLELIIGGEHQTALKNLKKMISENSSDPDTWAAFSSYFCAIGFSGRANDCEEKAESLS